MRDDTRDESRDNGWLMPVLDKRAPQRLSAERAGEMPTRLLPFGSTTLHARLALLRPRPIRLKPAGDDGR